MEVIGNFFQVLGVEPAIGRLFTLEESRSGAVVPNSTAQPFALLANAYWRRQFHSDPTIVGRAIELNGAPVTVVGVLPQSFDYGAVFSPGAKADLFVPVSLDKERMWGNIVTLVGRLKPGVTEAQALDDANRVAPDIYFNVKYPESRGRYKGNLVPIPLWPEPLPAQKSLRCAALLELGVDASCGSSSWKALCSRAQGHSSVSDWPSS
jgi:nucleotidyltransferase/DNA polymerase involved in DNA repair